MQDAHHVWLTLGSKELISGDDIADVIGIEPNNRPKKEGVPPRKSFGLHSDLAISISAPLIDHLNWLKNEVEGKEEIVREFVSRLQNNGSITILIQTKDNYGKVLIPSWFLLFIIGFGVDIQVTFISDLEDPRQS